MKVKWLGKTDFLVLTNNKIYDVISIERGWYRIIDDLDEDYLYPPDMFEVVEEDKWYDGKVILTEVCISEGKLFYLKMIKKVFTLRIMREFRRKKSWRGNFSICRMHRYHWEDVKDIWVKEEKMADKISMEWIAYIVERIVERAKEAVEESREDREDYFKDGRALAYYEVLDILRTELSVREISLEKIGLSFDLERKLL